MLFKEHHKSLEPNLKRNGGFSVSVCLQINTSYLSKKGILAKQKTVGLDTGEAEWNLMTYDLQEVRLDYLIVPSGLTRYESTNKSMKMLRWLTHFLAEFHFLLVSKKRQVLQCFEGKFLHWSKLTRKSWMCWCLVWVSLSSCIGFTLASFVKYLCW